MIGLGELPVRLRRYLLTVIVAGPAAVVIVAFAEGIDFGRAGFERAALLVLLAAVAEPFPIHLTHKTNVTVGTAAYLAMIFLFPPPVAGLLTLTAAVVGNAIRLFSRRHADEVAALLFDTGQTALAVVAAALCYDALKDVTLLGPQLTQLGGLGAMVVTASVYYAVNTGLVSVAAALHLGTNPIRIWQVTLLEDLGGQATMAALAVVAAVLAWAEPLVLPVLALPLVLVHRAIGENARLTQDTHGALAALVEVVELRDPYTAGHSRRVAATARALALRLGMTDEEADEIESAGRVHDLGKVAIDPVVLTKPGKLDEHEWAQMRRHPGLGADVVARFAAYGEGHQVVRYHHESWDGSGYPAGLSGETIPLGARILAVADTFDALTSARPYRAARTMDEALAILAAGAGQQWDAAVVAAMFAYLGAEPGAELAAAVARRPRHGTAATSAPA